VQSGICQGIIYSIPEALTPSRAGITRLEQLTEMSEAELRWLHGIGAHALATLRIALQERGMAFMLGNALLKERYDLRGLGRR
jgi:hypothetical protein